MNRTIVCCALALAAALWCVGCGPEEAPVKDGMTQGTLQLEGLTLEQQIQKVYNDPTIPPQFKESFINSLRAQAQAQAQGQAGMPAAQPPAGQ